MSLGISEIKKKTKLAMDEMYESQPVGQTDKQLSGLPEIKPTIQETIQPEIKPSITDQKESYNKNEKFENFHSRQQTKEPTFKMTFNLPKEFYKAFNDIYAQRIINGCKTEKSELICEAIHLLAQVEKGK